MDSIIAADHLVLEPAIPPLWAMAVALALAVVVVAGARRWPLAGGRWAALLVLRLLVVAGLVLLMLRPSVRWQGRRTVRAGVAVLVDATRSMGLRDALGPDGEPVTRIEAVRRAFASAGKPYGDLAARAVIHAYAFGTHTRPIDHFTPTSQDPRTDLADTLRFVAGREEDPGPFLPAAVILVSDGRANRSHGMAEAAARRLAERAVKVHAVAVGSETPTDRVRDVAVRDLRAPRRVFVGNRIEVRAVLATFGLKGGTVEAVLTMDGKEVARRRAVPGENRTVQELVFAPTAGEAGLARLALAVAPLDGELVTTNNRAPAAVRIEQGGIRILYLDGRLHPEGKYIARALGAAQEMELERRILVGAKAGAAAPAPADLDGFDVVVLGDLPASSLPAATIARIVERARMGSLSVLTLGGLAAYGPGGWAATPLAEILPVAIRADDGQVEGPIRFKPTAAGADHFVFGLDAVTGRAIGFDALPPLSGASAVGPVRPTARLLAESEDGHTLLAVRELGRSRVASLTADTTWQWVLAPAATGGARAHRCFWRGLVLWLAGRDGRPRADVWVMTDRTRYVIADPDRPPMVEVTVGTQGSEAPRVRLTGPATADVPVRRCGDSMGGPGPLEWQGTVPLSVPGAYTVVAEAAGGDTKRAETRLVAEAQDFEIADLLADHANLKRIAAAGGGTFRTVDRLGDLLADLASGLQPQDEAAERRLSLGTGRLFLAAVIALLAAEWFLRRRWEMA
ncbi:MAG: hypothetical protein AMS14_01335 [Planctomycetes bacterium DG_20]|nr:MAG: hypothetical protein AMS14_01335 [Planctomycetes bacterium DG_20]